MTAVQRRRLLKLAAFLAGPVARAEKRSGRRKLDMERYVSHGQIGLTKKFCNTSACALGWATVVFPRTFANREGTMMYRGVGFGDYHGVAEDFFGLDRHESSDAFASWYFRTASEEAAVLRKLAARR